MVSFGQPTASANRRISFVPWLAGAAAAVIGILVATPFGLALLVAIAFAAWLVVWSLHWRAAFFGLFLFLPIAAVPGILFQQQGWPTFLKDGLFLLPAYLGLILTLTRDRTSRWPLPVLLTLLLTSLTVVVVLEAARLLPSAPLVALIGLRSWLLYIPLIIAPTFVFLSITDLRRFTRMLVLVAFIPSVVGIAEFTLIAVGHPDLAYQWYGVLGADVSQGFGQVGVSDQLVLHRVPSTFTFVTQFVAYCLITAPICLTVSLSDPDARWRRVAAMAAVLVIAAGFASGSRTFYLWGPIEVGLVLLLVKHGRRQAAIWAAATLLPVSLTIGDQVVQVTKFITSLGWDYLVRTQAAEFPAVFQAVGLFGVGAGLNTGGSRYVLAYQSLPFGIEGWYALAFLELGLPGLILIVILWLVLLRNGWMAIRLTRESRSAPLAVGVFVILVSTTLNLYKGVSLEYDPLNVYFWFLAGLALALPRIDGERTVNFHVSSGRS